MLENCTAACNHPTSITSCHLQQQQVCLSCVQHYKTLWEHLSLSIFAAPSFSTFHLPVRTFSSCCQIVQLNFLICIHFFPLSACVLLLSRKLSVFSWPLFFKMKINKIRQQQKNNGQYSGKFWTTQFCLS